MQYVHLINKYPQVISSNSVLNLSSDICFFYPPSGPFSDAYFDRLSTSLGDSWKSLAEKLSISRVSVQRIVSSCSRLDDEGNMAAKQMLFQWFKTSPKACDKVLLV